jgi:hypothetical protein
MPSSGEVIEAYVLFSAPTLSSWLGEILRKKQAMRGF